jgi:hypothetical protein
VKPKEFDNLLETWMGDNSWVYNAGEDVDGDYIVVFQSWDDKKKCARSLVEALMEHGFEASVSGRSYDNVFRVRIDDKDRTKLELADTLIGLLSRGKKFEGNDEQEDMLSWLEDKLCDPSEDDPVFTFDLYQYLGQRGWEETGFADEYDMCCDCNKIIYTSATHYGDHGRFQHLEEGELVCRHCINGDIEKYFDWYCEQAPGTVSYVAESKPEGFVEVGSESEFMGRKVFDALKFERGFHRDQRDDPKKMGKWLKAKILDKFKDQLDNEWTDDCPDHFASIIFDISVGQFDCSWTIWVDERAAAFCYELLTAEDPENYKSKEGPGDIAERQLRGLSELPAPAPGMTRIAKLDVEGDSIEVKDVPQGQALR